MSGRPRGRPAKHARNISGLKNQGPKASSDISTFTEPPSIVHSPAAAADVASDNGSNYDSENDGLDAVAYLELDSDYDPAVDDNEGWNEIASEEFQDALLAHAVQLQEEMQDAKDADWIPS